MTKTGLSTEAILAFDSLIERVTEKFCEGADDLARKYGLSDKDVIAVVHERFGDMADVYTEWVQEAWEHDSGGDPHGQLG